MPITTVVSGPTKNFQANHVHHSSVMLEQTLSPPPPPETLLYRYWTVFWLPFGGAVVTKVSALKAYVVDF